MIFDPTTVAGLDEHLRFPSPVPEPQALACDGDRLWISSWETGRLAQLDKNQGTVIDEAESPGKPVGGVVTGDELRFVVSEKDDSRFIRRFVPGHGFKSEAIPCPDDTGSFLAFDGERLWLTQRRLQRVLELDAHYAVARTIESPAQILGATVANGKIVLSLWFGAKAGGAALGTLDPHAADPAVTVVARSPFVCIALGYDGSRFWTNDQRANAIVAFGLPA